jgi:hypothetical protein
MASLDRFVMNKIFFIAIKRSRLAEEKKSGLDFGRFFQDGGQIQDGGRPKAGPKKCPRDRHSNLGRSGFRMYTVAVFGRKFPVIELKTN